MKKFSFLIAVLLLISLAAAPASADAVDDLLKNFGLTEQEVEAFRGIVSGIDGTMTEREMAALLKSVLGDASSPKQAGTLSDGVYTHPLGFTLVVPDNWTVLEDCLGVTVALMGPVGEYAFAPTITVLVLSEERPDFETLTQADWDEALGPSLANYRSLMLDDFEYLGVPAHEFVCTHGAGDEAMIMQYLLYFNMSGRAFMITMTALAEEAVHEGALTAYDTLLSTFQVADDGIG